MDILEFFLQDKNISVKFLDEELILKIRFLNWKGLFQDCLH
jgi:hypothetical protein